MTNNTQTKDLSQMIDQLKASKEWNDDQLDQATALLCEKLNDSKVTLKNQIKVGSFYQHYENCILAGRNDKYDIGVYENHNIYIGYHLSIRGCDGENLEDFESRYKWEDFMENPNLIISEFQSLRESLGLK